MVVLASAITTKSGKALLSRQFVDLTKVRVEGLLAAFPKLLSPEKQHTFVETESVRYVYQPLESLYVLLLTNKSSNIMEDLETLHLLAKIVPEYCHALDEKEVIKNSFDIIFAFDEAIAMGYKERVNVSQIKHFTAMESNDEIRYKADMKAKMKQAQIEADRQRKAIEKKRMEERKFGISSASYEDAPRSYTPSPSYQRAPEPVVERRESKSDAPARSSKGLQLGSKNNKGSAIAQVFKEEEIVDVVDNAPAQLSSQASQNLSKIQISISEKIALVSENDGGLKSLEVKGELNVTVTDAKFARIKIRTSQSDNKEFQFKTHPNMNKNLYTNDSTLALKDQGKAYPLDAPQSILKWRFASKDEDMIPLVINVWPSTSGGQTTVPVEYEKKCAFDLHDVVVAIPIPGAAPVVGELVGSADYDQKKGILYWRVPLIDDSNPSGSLEFKVPNAPSSAFFPVQVSFKSNQTFCAIQAVQVVLDDGSDQPVDFAAETTLGVEQYTIE